MIKHSTGNLKRKEVLVLEPKHFSFHTASEKINSKNVRLLVIITEFLT